MEMSVVLSRNFYVMLSLGSV